MLPTTEGPLAGIVSLIGNDRVQLELGIVSRQLRSISESFERLNEVFLPRLQDLGRLPELEKRKVRSALIKELMGQADDILSAVLRQDQLARFQQLRIQKEGIAAFLNDRVWRELAITDGQDKQLRSAVQKGVRDIALAQRRSSTGGEDSLEIARETAMREVIALLTEEQATKWSQLLGEKFDFEISPWEKEMRPRK